MSAALPEGRVRKPSPGALALLRTRPGRSMRAEGFEPPRLAPPAPKAGVSASSTTPAATAARPEWFARDKTGFTSPPLNESILGLMTLLLIPVEFLLIAFAMRGFQQEWSVEVERPADGRRSFDDDDFEGAAARA